jgi:hypothetical protein
MFNRFLEKENLMNNFSQKVLKRNRNIWDNIKVDLEENILEVSTGYDCRLKQDSSGCLRCHSNKTTGFVKGEGQLLISVLSFRFCRWIVVPRSVSKTL